MFLYASRGALSRRVALNKINVCLQLQNVNTCTRAYMHRLRRNFYKKAPINASINAGLQKAKDSLQLSASSRRINSPPPLFALCQCQSQAWIKEGATLIILFMTQYR